MSVKTRSCPKCRQPITIPAARPAHVHCTNCGAGLNLTKSSRPQRGAASQGISESPSVLAPPPLLLPNGDDSTQVTSAATAVPSPAIAALPPNPQPDRNFQDSPSRGSRFLVLVMIMMVVFLFIATGAGLALFFFGPDKLGFAAKKKETVSGIDFSVDQLPKEPKAKVKKVPPEIKAAIGNGAAYLRRRIKQGGNLYGSGDHNVGAYALAGLTLLECGVSPQDEAVKKCVQIVQSSARQNLTNTYSVSLATLFMDRLVESPLSSVPEKEAHKQILKKLALQLIAAQGRTGGWNYTSYRLAPPKEKQLLQALEDGKFRPGAAGYRRGAARHDNSIAQFAVLALWVARKYGIPVSASLRVEEERYRKQQHRPSGAWRYTGARGDVTPQMTCSGLIGVAVGHAIRDEFPASKSKKTGARVDLSRAAPVKKGLQFVGKALDGLGDKGYKMRRRLQELGNDLKKAHARKDSVEIGRITKEIADLRTDAARKRLPLAKGAMPNLYFLWSLERVAVIYGLDKVDNRDWYDRGSKVILEHQTPGGSWTAYGGAVGTCFALLFLNRSNLVKDLTDKLRELRAELSPGNRFPMPQRQDA